MRLVLAGIVMLTLTGCNPYDPGQRAIAGGLLGAGSGAAIGAAVGGGPGAAMGAAIGGTVGAFGGAVTTPYYGAPRYYWPPSYGYGYPSYYPGW
jgi:hypothetical protein